MAEIQGFDAQQVEPLDSFEPLPAGKYLAVLIESENRATRSGAGSYLYLTFEVIEGPHKGRRLWSRLNLDNPNQDAVRIARSQLSSLCRAVGVMAPKDSAELHNLPVVLAVVQKAGLEGTIQNEIKNYSAVDKPQIQPTPGKAKVAMWKKG